MMKTRSKLSKAVALCLTLLMVVGLLSTTAFAEVAPTSTGTITVSGVEDKLIVSAYRLMTVQVNENGQPQEPVYTWVDEVATWLRSTKDQTLDFSSYVGGENDNSVQPAFNGTDVNDTAGGSKTFYDALAAAIRGGTITSFEPTKTETTSDGRADLSDMPMGNYLILIENGMKVYSPSAVNLVPKWNNDEWQMSDATVEVKSSELTITKTVKAPNTTEGKEADNASMGDTVTFDIVTDVPQFPASAIAKNYAISDILPDGLTLTEDPIQVYGVNGDDETPLTNGDTTYYMQDTARPNNLGNSTFTLTFYYDTISSYEKIHVTYTATLNDSADLGTTGNSNNAYLDYTNNPYTSESWQSQDDSATVYTYGLDISKVDKKDNETFLSGAQFELYASEADATSGDNKISFVMESEGVYHKVAADTEGAVTTLTVGSGNTLGKLTLKGLDAGTWYLKETKAPGGYNLLASPVSVEIADSDLNGSVTVNEQDITTGLVPLNVENDNGFRLPVTGGMGTILFTAVGAVLMGAAVILLVIVLKRKKAENK